MSAAKKKTAKKKPKPKEKPKPPVLRISEKQADVLDDAVMAVVKRKRDEALALITKFCSMKSLSSFDEEQLDQALIDFALWGNLRKELYQVTSFIEMLCEAEDLVTMDIYEEPRPPVPDDD